MNKMTGQGCPTNKLQGAIGQFYENTNNGDIYECQSILKDCNGVSCCNWVLRASGEHIDDHAEIFGSGGGGASLPETSHPHQQLVTDKDGNAVWEEKLCYKVDNEVIIPETHFDDMFGGDGIVIDTKLVEGEEYVVVWNGAEYRCVAVKRSDIDHPTDFTRKVDGVLLGDAHCWTAYSEITDEPFGLVQYDDSVGWPEVRVANKEGPQYSCTIFVYKENGHVKKIDPKYLPGSKYAQPDWGVDANGEILPEMAGEVNEDMGGVIVATPLNAPIVGGNMYTVGFNGTEYQCTAVYIEEQNGYVIGNGAMMGLETPDTDAPFALIVMPPETAAQTGMYAACIPLDGSASCTFYITGEMIHKIPDDYIEGGGVYYFGVDDAGTITTTFDEILTALKNGKQVYANYGMNIIPVSAWSNEYISLFGVIGHSASHLQAYSLSLSARGENSFKFVSIATV